MRPFLMLSIVLLAACDSSSTEGYDLSGTRALDNSFFLEVYSKSYGVYGGSESKYFVTDSVGYRQYIGSCDDKEFFKVYVSERKILAEKFSRRNLKNKQEALIDAKHYELSL